MRKVRSKIFDRWKFLRALVVGVLFTAGLSYLIASSKNLNSYTEDSVYKLDINAAQAPQYLGKLAPPFSKAWIATPFGSSTGNFLYSLVPDFGTDFISYSYADQAVPTNWSPESIDDTPPLVSITRYRFGWPMRSMYWDAIGWIPSPDRLFHEAYRQKIKAVEGLNIGFETPRWWPTSGQNYRMPIKLFLVGFVLNTLFYASLWLVPGLVIRCIKRYFREHRGLCVECGYEIEELAVCPECGVEVEEAV